MEAEGRKVLPTAKTQRRSHHELRTKKVWVPRKPSEECFEEEGMRYPVKCCLQVKCHEVWPPDSAVTMTSTLGVMGDGGQGVRLERVPDRCVELEGTVF